jgi:hypothetical protein
MTPEWYFRAMEQAEYEHDPRDYDGREWEELSEEEKEKEIDSRADNW